MNELNQNLRSGIERYLESEKRNTPQYTHRASSVGHPCSRFLFYSIHDWEKSAPLTNAVLGVMKTGTRLEDTLVDIFNGHIGPNCRIPMRIISTQTPVRDKLMEEYKISGTFDGILQQKDGESWANLGIVDIKTCSSNLFQTYHDAASLNRHTWSSLYATQAMLYAFSNNMEKAYLMFVGKGNIYHDWKLIEIAVDYEHVEQVLQKCAAVNAALEKPNPQPPPKLNKPMWCNGCRFEPICLPELDYDGSGPRPNEDPHIESLVERLMALKPYVKEYEAVDKELKASLVKGQDLILKKSLIQWKQIHATRQPTPGGEYSYWVMKVLATENEEELSD